MRYRLNVTAEPFEYEGFEGGLELGEAEWNGEVSGGSRSRPEYITWVQAALNRALGLRLEQDGVSGPKTRSAIRSFQRRYGLTVDGVVGPITEAALEEGIRAARTLRGSSSPRARHARCRRGGYRDGERDHRGAAHRAEPGQPARGSRSGRDPTGRMGVSFDRETDRAPQAALRRDPLRHL